MTERNNRSSLLGSAGGDASTSWHRPLFLMAPEGDGGGGSGGGDGQTGNPAGGDPGQDKTSGEGGGEANPGAAYVDRATLTQVLASQRKAIEREQQKQLRSLKETIDKLTSRLPAGDGGGQSGDDPRGGSGSADGDGQGKSTGSEQKLTNPEVARLQREMANLQKKLEANEQVAQAEKTKRLDADFHRSLTDALTKHGCRKPDVALRVIAPDFKRELQDDGTERVFAILTDELGQTVELGPADYVEQYVRTEQLPELFAGRTAPSSPAGQGGGSQTDTKYKFTADQLRDPEFYAKNRKEIHEAERAGLIKT